jgi:hypothetical protein
MQTFDTSTALHWTAVARRRQETMHNAALQIQLLQYLAIYLGFAPHSPVCHTHIDDLLIYFMKGFAARVCRLLTFCYKFTILGVYFYFKKQILMN